MLQSGLHRQLMFALSLDPDARKGIMSITRQGRPGPSVEPLSSALAEHLPPENRGSVKPPASGNYEDEAYSDSFQLQARLVVGGGMRRAISARVEPSVKNKSVMDIYQEALCHLALCQRLGSGQGPGDQQRPALDGVLAEVRTRLQAQHASAERHPPLLLVGQPGTGKSTLLATIYREAEAWLGCPVNRIVRICGQSLLHVCERIYVH
ncbi:hypothetical protein FOCC_FOCC003237, partial [Frankliniella occidentalis]